MSEILDGIWRINVSGQVYGPYTGHQIKAFAAEGRIAPHSIVQADEKGPWITAIDDPVLAQLFVKKQLPAAHAMTLARQTGPTAAQAVQPAGPASANFVVIIEIKSHVAPAFDPAMSKLGVSLRLNPHVWLLHTDRSANDIRSEIVQHLGPRDTLFVVDATRGKSIWFNLDPEAEAKVCRLWKGPQYQSESQGASRS